MNFKTSTILGSFFQDAAGCVCVPGCRYSQFNWESEMHSPLVHLDSFCKGSLVHKEGGDYTVFG